MAEILSMTLSTDTSGRSLQSTKNSSRPGIILTASTFAGCLVGTNVETGGMKNRVLCEKLPANPLPEEQQALRTPQRHSCPKGIGCMALGAKNSKFQPKLRFFRDFNFRRHQAIHHLELYKDRHLKTGWEQWTGYVQDHNGFHIPHRP